MSTPREFEVEKLSRDERTRRFRASVIGDVEAEPEQVKDFVGRASDRYLDRFGSG